MEPQGGHRSENKPLSCILSPQHDSLALSRPILGLGATIRIWEEAGVASRVEEAWRPQTGAEKKFREIFRESLGTACAIQTGPVWKGGSLHLVRN